MNFNWLPWKFLIRAAARKHGFLDPIGLLSHLSKFSQPSEVAEPIELLRAGVIFHARGLINSRVIQHNLDWVWPYWVERQFNPSDISFIPRAFSLTHVNLTHRNWTAIGVPDYSQLPLVDPRGLITPFLDKWSLDTWVISEEGRELLPSREENTQQYLNYSDGVRIVTNTSKSGLELTSIADVALQNDKPICNIKVSAKSNSPAWLVISLRPYNPEGIAFIYDVEMKVNRSAWFIDKKYNVLFDHPIDRHYVSTFNQGDVYTHLHDVKENNKKHCAIGLITSAALFKLEKDTTRTIKIQVPLSSNSYSVFNLNYQDKTTTKWKNSLNNVCQLSIPDKRIVRLYETSIRTLVLCSPEETFPGPYTYKRFWFRDAAFITCGLLYSGLIERAERSLRYFPKRQTHSGYFHSQEGEWDSNGEALWILKRFFDCTNKLPEDVDWWPSIKKGGRWIMRKRLSDNLNTLHAGLLPAGFSAEHLGPSDFYYWDDFWSVAGLEAASFFAEYFNERKYKKVFTEEAKLLSSAIEKSLIKTKKRMKKSAIPASPYRRMDAGAIGSLAAGYPLQLFAPNDERLMNTVEFILQKCFMGNGFFQDMIHSGVNPYLTLHVAQILMRAGDPRYFNLLQHVADLASPTGQWPEAIHPHTLGGCMGDGQHAWAAAEWIIMLRNCFIREEDNYLILASGISRQWLESQEELSFGPAPTTFGNIYIRIRQNKNAIVINWDATWWKQPDRIEIKLPGLTPIQCKNDDSSAVVSLGNNA
jgi:GH15 family glucan-1,4-alpha-glucosidase